MKIQSIIEQVVIETGVTTWLSVMHARAFKGTIDVFRQLHHMPRPVPPLFCDTLKSWRWHEAKMATGFGLCGASLKYFGESLLVGNAALLFSATHAVFLVNILRIERKFCKGPHDGEPKKQDDEVGSAIVERLRELMGEWQPAARVITPQTRYEYWKRVAPNDFADQSCLGTGLTFITVLGGMAAAGAASGLSWAAESAIGTVPRLPAFGY